MPTIERIVSGPKTTAEIKEGLFDRKPLTFVLDNRKKLELYSIETLHRHAGEPPLIMTQQHDFFSEEEAWLMIGLGMAGRREVAAYLEYYMERQVGIVAFHSLTDPPANQFWARNFWIDAMGISKLALD